MLLTIGQTAKVLGVSIQTLRRWDEAGKLSSVVRENSSHRRYSKKTIERFIRDNTEELSLFKMAQGWTKEGFGREPFADFYCADVSMFQGRLSKLETELSKVRRLDKTFPLISAIVGEIGNNSFDHNLGNWPDVMGIFFIWSLKRGKIILADRGQGIFATLKKVRPELKNHQDALRTAFTEIVSARAPEYRGNGLKFVREVVATNKISLFFQTGDAELKIKKDDCEINIKRSTINLRGCLVEVSF